MKRLIGILIVLSFLTCIISCNRNRQSAPYLSIAATYYDDGKGPEKGMTISVLRKELNGGLEDIGEVAYTSQYPLAVYDQQDHSIYYSAVDDSEKNDQVWCLNLDTQSVTQLTSNMFSINYIIPRKTDLIIIGMEKMERQLKPFVYDKKSGVMAEIKTGIDFNCSLCTYNAKYDRLIMVGTSYKQTIYLREKWNEGQQGVESDKDNMYYPPDTYIYEVGSDRNATLILKLNQYQVKHIAIRNADEIVYSGFTLIHSDVPMTQFSFKTGHKPEKFDVFSPTFPLTIYDEFIFSTNDDIYLLGMGSDSKRYPYGIYHYKLSNRELNLIYDGKLPHDAYINNFLLLGT